jgi:hypothetical protein
MEIKINLNSSKSLQKIVSKAVKRPSNLPQYESMGIPIQNKLGKDLKKFNSSQVSQLVCDEFSDNEAI